MRHPAFVLLFLLHALGCSAPAMDDELAHSCQTLTGPVHKFVTDSIWLIRPPSQRIAFDFDGDNRPENQFRKLMQLGDSFGIDVNSVEKTATDAGQGLLLFELVAPDPMQSDCASLTLTRALPPSPGEPPPQFNGAESFRAEESSRLTIYGRVDGGVFRSFDWRSPSLFTDRNFALVLWTSPEERLTLPLRGLQVEARLSIDSGSLTFELGMLGGVVEEVMVRDVITPSLARIATRVIRLLTPKNLQDILIQLLENDKLAASREKCLVAADCCRLSVDTCKILPEEVRASIIGDGLSMDVEVFDDAGNWRPVPMGQNRNGYSMAVGFHTVPARF